MRAVSSEIHPAAGGRPGRPRIGVTPARIAAPPAVTFVPATRRAGWPSTPRSISTRLARESWIGPGRIEQGVGGQVVGHHEHRQVADNLA